MSVSSAILAGDALAGGAQVKSRGVQGARVLAVRLSARLLRRAVIVILMFFAPVSAAAYVLAVPRGVGIVVAVALLSVAVFFALGVVAAYRTTIWVVPAGITTRGFFGRLESFANEDVKRVVMLELLRRDGVGMDPQLFVIGLDGTLLLRMRGQFWSVDDVRTIAEGFDVPISRVPEPMSLRELNDARPEWLSWFERRISRPI